MELAYLYILHFHSLFYLVLGWVALGAGKGIQNLKSEKNGLQYVLSFTASAILQKLIL